MNPFSVTKRDPNSSARTGRLKITHGTVKTPVFLPIGTKATVKSLSNSDLIDLGCEMILSNTYHLWESLDEELVKSAGGLHGFTNWDRSIFTDSGGFQIFSLGERMARKNPKDIDLPFNIKVSEEGVTFQKGSDGDKMMLSPEKSVQIQSNLGSDIAVVLDEFTADINSESKVLETVDRTTRWAKRSKDELLRIKKVGGEVNSGQLLLGIVQGGMIESLRKKSAQEIADLDFDGYCIGGVAVGGESSHEQYKAVDMSMPFLPEESFKHLLGVGTPDQIIQNVLRGCDSFDCVIPTREARHGRIYIATDSGYKTIDISKSEFADDLSRIDEDCECYACMNHSKAYLHHMLRSGELLAFRLLTLHNVNFYLRLMETIRSNIENETFTEFANNYSKN